ncbi:MAG: aminotransferase class V-fold PLP-dependent enzyme, partial [Myxococcales bacterium]
MTYPSGRHFLQIPGPTNVPDRVLRAMDRPTIDHRGPEFATLAKEVLTGIRKVFGTTHPVVIYPSSGTGAWEAALVNTLSPGDRVLMFETGHFAALWRGIADRHELRIEMAPRHWRHGLDPAVVEEKLATDPQHSIKAVCAPH